MCYCITTLILLWFKFAYKQSFIMVFPDWEWPEFIISDELVPFPVGKVFFYFKEGGAQWCSCVICSVKQRARSSVS